MRLCFLVEEQYRHDGMPLDVIRQLGAWGHQVDVLWPGRSLISLSDAIQAGSHDAWVLKTVSGGPGLTLLEAAASAGLTTVNDVRAIRGVRDKALAAVIARGTGLPVPVTYAAARPEELAEIPEAEFPLVVKPADGSSGRAVRLVATPDRLLEPVAPGDCAGGLLIAQPYVPNSGTDLKVYSVAGELYATERCSPCTPRTTYANVRYRSPPRSPGSPPGSARSSASTSTASTSCSGPTARWSSTSTTFPASVRCRTRSPGCPPPYWSSPGAGRAGGTRLRRPGGWLCRRPDG